MAEESIGKAVIDLVVNSKELENKVKSAVDEAAKTASKSAPKMESAFSSSMKKVGGFIKGAFAIGTVVNFTKKAVQSASAVQSAFTGLNSIVQGVGGSMGKAQKFITDYTADGLLTVTEAASAYKNLLSRGYDTKQIEDTLNRLKDSAAFGRQASYNLGEAVVSATEGLKNENSILVDNAGVTKNVAKMWEEYAKSIGKTTNQLTQQEKIQAEYNGIMAETKFQVGDAATYTTTFAGRVQMLKGAFANMKTAIGKVVAPIVGAFIPAIVNAINYVTTLFNKLAGLLKMFGLEFPDVVSKGSAGVEKAVEGISGMGDKAADTAENIAGTGKAAKKAAKQINKAFAGVDEINVLNTGKSSSTGGDSSSVVGDIGGADMGNSGIEKIPDMVETSGGAIDKVISKVNELKNLFMDGFKIGWDDTSFDEILTKLKSIGETVKSIFDDPKVKNAAADWANSFTLNLGKVVGSAGRIGVNAATLLVGSVENYLNQNSERIKKYLVNMFDISGDNNNILGDVSVFLADISDIFAGATARQIGADIITIFSNPFMSAVELAGKLGRDILSVITEPFITNKDKIGTAISEALKPIETVTSTLAEAFTYIGDKVNELYDEHLKPFLDNVKIGASDTFGKFLDVYNAYVLPFCNLVADGMKNTWEQHLKPTFDKLTEFIGKIIDVINFLWKNVLKPVVDFLITYVVPVVVDTVKSIWTTVKDIIDRIIDIIGGVIDVLNGVIDFIIGVFTGDWDRAWDGIEQIFTGFWDVIKNIFGTVFDVIAAPFKIAWDFIKSCWNRAGNYFAAIWDTIKAAFKYVKDWFKDIFSQAWQSIKNVFNGVGSFFDGVWNTIKRVFTNIGQKIGDSMSGTIKGAVNAVLKTAETVLNKPITAINKMLDVINTIPGVNIGKLKTFSLPRLARGGWLPANEPRLAIVGDNKREPEIVTPESKIYEQVKKALGDVKEKGESVVRTLELHIYHHYEDGRIICQKINQAQIEEGKILLMT